MEIKNSFLKKIGIYFIGTISTRMLGVILVPIYAYFVHPEDLGQYDYIYALVNIISPILYLLIWEALLRYCINQKESDKKEALITTVVSFFVVVSLLLMIIGGIFYIYQKKITIILLCLLIIGYAGASLWQFAARALNENKRYVVAGVIGSVATIVIDIMCILFLQLDYVGLCIANVLSQVMIIIVIENKVKLLQYVCLRRIDRGILKKLLLFSAPLAVNSVSLWANTGSCKIIIQNNVGVMENGLYSFASKFSIIISLFSLVISMAVTEEAYSSDDLNSYRKKMTKIISEISKAYFCLIYVAIPAIYILYNLVFKNTDYYESVNYIVFLLLGSLFTALANNFGSAFQITDTTRYLFITTLIGAISTISLSLILCNVIGIYGVLIGGMIGPFMMMLTRAVYAKRTTGLRIRWGKNIYFFSLILIECILLALNHNIIIQIICFIITIVICVFEYRNDMKKIGKVFIKKSGNN